MPKRILGVLHLIKLFNSCNNKILYAEKCLDPRFSRTSCEFGFVGPSIGLSFCDKFSKEWKGKSDRGLFFTKMEIFPKLNKKVHEMAKKVGF